MLRATAKELPRMKQLISKAVHETEKGSKTEKKKGGGRRKVSNILTAIHNWKDALTCNDNAKSSCIRT